MYIDKCVYFVSYSNENFYRYLRFIEILEKNHYFWGIYPYKVQEKHIFLNLELLSKHGLIVHLLTKKTFLLFSYSNFFLKITNILNSGLQI